MKIVVIGTCSNKPRASTQNSYHRFGHQHWAKDAWHIKQGERTACGIKCNEWIDLGEQQPDHNLCSRCQKKIEYSHTLMLASRDDVWK